MQFAFICPGQGSQTIGMLSNLTIKYPDIKKTFYEASAILGYDLWELIQYGPVAKLNKTYYAQPALLCASIALWRIWQKEQGNVIPAFIAGHSLGEYSALVCSGVIQFLDAVYLVKMRSKFMQEAVPIGTGAMSAIIGLDDTIITQICKQVTKGQIVSQACYNSLDQIVIAGHKDAVERASSACLAAGAKHVFPLPVSIPSHCELMKPAAKKLAAELKKITFSTPIIPIINNVDVKCETTPEAIRDALVRQLYKPVQWTKIIKYMAAHDIKHIYEIGPGKILTNMTKNIVSYLTVSTINELNEFPVAL